jgi:hypothetical protein
VLLGLAVTVGLLVVVAGPFLAHLGVSGFLLGVVLVAVVLLRSRRSRARPDVAVQLLGGVAALAALAVSAALVHPGWRTALAGALVGTGVVLLLASSAPARSRLWLGRAADVAEGVALVAVLPLVVLAAGLISAVRS